MNRELVGGCGAVQQTVAAVTLIEAPLLPVLVVVDGTDSQSWSIRGDRSIPTQALDSD